LTGRSSTHRPWMLDRPVKPGDDTGMVNGLVSQRFVVNDGVVQYTMPAPSTEETHAFGS
jgi:hypothetical protein